LNKELEALYKKYTKPEYLVTDPIQFAYRYKRKEDIEIVAFISALFSYGNVPSITKHLENLFQLFTNNPSDFFQKPKGLEQIKTKIPYYRFQTQKDIFEFLCILKLLWKENNTLEQFFLSNEKGNHRILTFQNTFWKFYKNIFHTKPDRGLEFLIGKPNLLSTNKRYWMFLRWMVRSEFPDLGIYKQIEPKDLYYPLDVHIQKMSKILNTDSRKTNDFKKVEQITQSFEKLYPQDPVKYDFPLSRLGILKKCKGHFAKEICSVCEIRAICKIINSNNF
jgi:uncharacterized protein (TIGR02757 family)